MKKFCANEEVKRIVAFIRNYYQENELGGVVIGISGGKDSAVVAGLFVEALGNKRVIGVTLPCHSNLQDRMDAKIISDYYGFPLHHLDLTDVFDSFIQQLPSDLVHEDLSYINSNVNLKPRLRMASLYYLAALFTEVYHQTYLVAGTSNRSELYVGYFTKGGDNVHDISILADFTVSEVIQLGEVIGVPSQVLYKTPSDGLSKQSDEDKLGVTYQQIEDYMDGKLVDEEVCEKIYRLHVCNQHKFSVPTYRKNRD